jgi:glutamate--cysteine ligase
MSSFLDVLETLKTRGQLGLLTKMFRGIEKENLRVDLAGQVSQASHPEALGKTLTHPWITTDFSESLLEVVTPPACSVRAALNELTQVSAYVLQHMADDELMWPGSMPPHIADPAMVQLAQYGPSHSGQMKQIYRRGLCYRYGRVVQSIAGMHYNLSFSDELFQALYEISGSSDSFEQFKNERYMGLIRNFFRVCWIIPYLFGATPACDETSVTKPVDYLKTIDDKTYFGEYATSLRLSDLGYQNKCAKDLKIDYNHLDAYVETLLSATVRKNPEFEAFGVQDEGGNYIQLSDALLQIENEYYSPIRPKQIVKRCERPATALRERGIQYVEVRLLDLNPLEPVNASSEALHFLDNVLLHCLLEDSPLMSEEALSRCRHNFYRVVTDGRNPELTLSFDEGDLPFKKAANTLLNKLDRLSGFLDTVDESTHWHALVQVQQAKVDDPTKTLSARVLAELKASKLSYHDWLLSQAVKHKASLAHTDIPLAASFDQLAVTSTLEYEALSHDVSGSISDYLACYFSDQTG